MSKRSSKKNDKVHRKEEMQPEQTVELRWLQQLILVVAALYAILHIYAAFNPSGQNWGIHLLAFLLPVVRIVFPALMLAVLIPSVQVRVLGMLEKGVRAYSSLSLSRRRLAVVIGFAVTIGLFWIGRESLAFLGDGMLALGNLTSIRTAESIPVLLQNAPLSGLLTWTLYKFFVAKSFATPDLLSFQVLSIATGAACLILIALITRHIATERIERVIAFLFIMAATTSQMFFGYVENYSPALLTVVLFVYLSLEYLRGRVHLVFPSIAFGLMFASHFGMFYMFPALLFLYFLSARKKKWWAIGVAVVVTVVATLGVLSVSGYSPQVVKEIFLKEGGSHMVPLFKQTNGWHAFTMFSLPYLSERANYYLLLGPFALLIVAVLSPFTLKSLSLKQSQWIFLLFMGLFSLAFTFAFNFDIGMSRDWDLLAPYNISLVVAAAFAWFRFVRDPALRRRLMVVMTAVTLIHTTAYVVLNAEVEPSVERFQMLRDPAIWGPAALIYGSESLGTYYRQLGDNQKAVDYYRKGLAIDSTNSRRWLAIAGVYQALGQGDNFRHALEMAVETGTSDIQVHLRLGEDYLREGHVDRAVEIWKKGLKTNPNATVLAYYIGQTLAERRGAYDEAIGYLLQAARSYPDMPEVLNAVGSCYYHLGKTAEMKAYWSRLLQVAPRFPEADRIRRIIAESR